MSSDDAKVVYNAELGKHVLVDPTAYGAMQAISKHNCKRTVELQQDRVQYFRRRIEERGLGAQDVVILLINVDDAKGAVLADAAMPGHDWQAIRDQGQIPFARGLADREGVQEFVDLVDEDASAKLRELQGVALVVVDFDTVEVFDVT